MRLMALFPILACLGLVLVTSKLSAVDSRVVDGVLVVNDQPFIPIMIWLQPADSFNQLAGIGINTIAGYHWPADIDAATAEEGMLEAVREARNDGMYYVLSYYPAGQDSAYERISRMDNVIAWIHGDEPDLPKRKNPENHSRAVGTWKPQATPGEVLQTRDSMRRLNPDLPAFMTLTSGFMANKNERYTPAQKAVIYPPLIELCDVVGFDTYPIYGYNLPSHLFDVALGVSELRNLAGKNRMVYAWIEANKGSRWMPYDEQLDVLPKHTRAEVWMALISGARGIGYFTHAWRPEYKPFACTKEMQQELKRLNAQITRLTPAICAEPVTSVEMQMSGGLAGHLMATRYEGSVWIFAQNVDLGQNAENLQQGEDISPRAGQAKLSLPGLPGGINIEVIDEGRAIISNEGFFEDHFDPLAEHIYRVFRSPK